MMTFYLRILFAVLFTLLLFNPVIVFAKREHTDMMTVKNNENLYYYYSSPKHCAYIKILPEDYTNITTQITQDLDPLTMKVGDEFRFKIVENVNLTKTLILPKDSTLVGKITHITQPTRLIKNSRIKIDFVKVIFTNNYELPLNNDTFEVSPLIIKKGSRYEFAKEIGYTILLSGSKYPVGKFINVGTSFGIFGGAGAVGGALYGIITDKVAKEASLGTLRFLGGKTPYNFIVRTGKSFTVKTGDTFLMSLYRGNVDHMVLLPQYLNLPKLMMSASMNSDKSINDAIISKSSTGNKNTMEVINFYKNNLNSNPEDIEASINLGRTYLSTNRYQNAIQHFQGLIVKGIKDARINYYLGNAYENAGNLLEAKKQYYNAIENNFNNKEIYLKLAGVLQKLGEAEEANNIIKKYNSEALVNNN